MKPLSISVFFPAYNDECSIPKLVEDAISVIKPLTEDYEIIVVDDGSPDNVGAVADEMARKDRHIKVVHHEKNKGYGGALKSGFEASTKEYIFYTDGDAQYDVKEITRFLPYREEYDLVNGYKIKRGDKFHRVFFGKLYNRIARICFNLPVSDVDCDFRLFKSKVVKSLGLKSNEGFICVEMMHKMGEGKYKVKEVPVNHYPRLYGESQFFNYRSIQKSLKNFARGWWELIILEKIMRK